MKNIQVGRARHLIDIENLYAAHHGVQYETWFAKMYRDVVGVGPNDLITVAADRSHALEIDAVFPGAQKVWGYGPDGADRQLIDSIDWPSLVRGCDTLVIASGDWYFLDAAYQARTHGLRVLVASRTDCLSKRLAPYADAVIEFPEFDPAVPPQFVRAA